jgi:hypothetical protein
MSFENDWMGGVVGGCCVTDDPMDGAIVIGSSGGARHLRVPWLDGRAQNEHFSVLLLLNRRERTNQYYHTCEGLVIWECLG